MSAGAFLLSQRKSDAPWPRRESSGIAGFYPVTEIASGVNDRRPNLLALLKDTSVTRIVVEHQDRLTRFGFHYLEALLQAQGRTIEIVNLAETDNEDLIADLVAIVYSCTAQLYGQRRAKRTTERIAAELRGEDGEDATR